jgi:hypothetical protein
VGFVFEKLRKVLTDHATFFQLILRLKMLLRAAFEMTQSLVLDEALEKIVQHTITTIGCDRSTCFVADLSKGELWSKVA